MEVTQILIGHVSQETAYVVDDYPYGFRLRCSIRYWLEFKPKQGVRLVSQTSNPKRPGLVWNKPKASTYCRFGGCMFLDENGHVQWSGLTEYSDAASAEAWRDKYGAGVPEDCKPLVDAWCKAKRNYETRRDAGEIAVTVTSQPVKRTVKVKFADGTIEEKDPSYVSRRADGKMAALRMNPETGATELWEVEILD